MSATITNIREATEFGDRLWRPKALPSYGVELDPSICAHVKETLELVWKRKGVKDARKPACWVVGPGGGLLAR